MEWSHPGIVLAAAPYGEGDLVVSFFSEALGVWRGLARGGASRRHASLWQAGNLVEARWIARLETQLGSLSGELVHAPGAAILDDPLGLGILAAATATAESALPERQSHPDSFAALLGLVAHLTEGEAALARLVRFELALLTELGYGIDISSCALTGSTADLAYVSPKTGRAAGREAAGAWAGRLLELPRFLVSAEAGDPAQWSAGLRLTGHFLEHRALAALHKPMPPARLRLLDRLARDDGLPS